MNKSELVDHLHLKLSVHKVDIEAVINETIQAIQASLANGGDVVFRGFGTFSVANRAEKVGRNPQTGAKVTIPARRVATFKPGTDLKALVNL